MMEAVLLLWTMWYDWLWWRPLILYYTEIIDELFSGKLFLLLKQLLIEQRPVEENDRRKLTIERYASDYYYYNGVLLLCNSDSYVKPMYGMIWRNLASNVDIKFFSNEMPAKYNALCLLKQWRKQWRWRKNVLWRRDVACCGVREEWMPMPKEE